MWRTFCLTSTGEIKWNEGSEESVTCCCRWALESITSIFLNTRLGCLDQDPSEDTKTLIDGANVILGPDMFRLITLPPFYKYIELPYFR